MCRELVSQNPIILQQLGKVDCRGKDVTGVCFVWSGFAPPPPSICECGMKREGQCPLARVPPGRQAGEPVTGLCLFLPLTALQMGTLAQGEFPKGPRLDLSHPFLSLLLGCCF